MWLIKLFCLLIKQIKLGHWYHETNEECRLSSVKFSNIAQVIEQRINSGEYPVSAQLPTHRVLATELNTTPVTVAKAYKLLADKGRLESFVGRGTFVSQSTHLAQAIVPNDDNEHFNFSILQPCLYKNIQSLQRAYQAVATKLSADMIGYTEHSGHQEHRQAGVDWAKKYGLDGGNADNTVLTNGAQHALSLLIDALTQPGDTIAVEALTYPGILAIANIADRKVVGVAMDTQGIVPQALEDVIKAQQPKLVIVVPSHQNPTGITMPDLRRRALAKVIEKNSIWLIEDDIYGFLNQKTIPAISNFVPQYSFHISSLSKAISPAMRCGYIKAPMSQVALLNAHIRANIWLSSPINFLAATALIDSGEAFAMAQVQRETAVERQALARRIFPQITCDATGYHIWLPLPQHWKSELFIIEAKNRGLIVSSGSYFDADGHDAGNIRLSLMSISTEQRLEQGLRILQELIASSENSLFPF